MTSSRSIRNLGIGRALQAHYALHWLHTDSYVRVEVDGNPSLDDLSAILRQIAADAESWERPVLLLDLRGKQKELSMSEQLLFGGAIARTLPQLRMVAVLQAPGRKWSAAGQRTANQENVDVGVFNDESEALDWLLEMDAEGDSAHAVLQQGLGSSPVHSTTVSVIQPGQPRAGHMPVATAASLAAAQASIEDR